MADTATATAIDGGDRKRQGRPSRYEDARGAIRDAAVGLFAERGFEATSVADIAAAAGVPKANVLYYFTNKDELWKEAIDHLWAEVDVFFRSRLPARLPVDRDGLALFLRTYLEACQRFPAYAQIPKMEGHAPGWRAQWLGERHLKRHVTTAGIYFRRLIAAGVLPDIEPVVFQNIMAGGGYLFIGQEELWRVALGDEEREIDFVELYIEGFMKLIDRASDRADRIVPARR